MHHSRFASVVLIVTALIVSGCQKRPAENAGRTAPEAASSVTPATNRPLLAARIDNVSLYPVPNNQKNLAVSLVVSVTNTGAPSASQDWRLEVNTPAGKDPLTLEPVHVSGIVEMPGGAGQKVDLAKEDLAVKAARTSVTQKERLTGILTFVLKETSEKTLATNNTRLVVHFKDQQGNSYQTPQVTLGAKPKAK